MAKQKKVAKSSDSLNIETIEVSPTPINVNGAKYVVVRNNLRVSDIEYDTKAEAETEFNFWKKVVTRWPDGTKVEIVPKDDRLHRVWAD